MGRCLIMQNKTQRERFEETARKLECDEDEKRFDDTVKKVAKAGGGAKSPKDE